VARLVIKLSRSDALRCRGTGGGAGALMTMGTTDDNDCKDQYRRRRTPHRISLYREWGYSRPLLSQSHVAPSTLAGTEHGRCAPRARGMIACDAHVSALHARFVSRSWNGHRARHGTTQHCTARHGAARRGAARRGAARRGTRSTAQAQHNTIRYGTAAAGIAANMERAKKLSSRWFRGLAGAPRSSQHADNANQIGQSYVSSCSRSFVIPFLPV